MATSVDGSFGTVVDRPRVIAGRLADPDAVDEVTISESFAEQAGVKVGSVFATVSLTPEQVARADFTPQGPTPRFGVVGIVRSPADLSDLAASGGIITLTPAFDRAYNGKIALFTLDLRLRVAGGAAGIAHVTDVARQIFGSSDSFRETIRARRTVVARARSTCSPLRSGSSRSSRRVQGSSRSALSYFERLRKGTRSNRSCDPGPHPVGSSRGGHAMRAADGGRRCLHRDRRGDCSVTPVSVRHRETCGSRPRPARRLVRLALGAAAILIFVLGVALAAGIRATRLDADRAPTSGRSIAKPSQCHRCGRPFRWLPYGARSGPDSAGARCARRCRRGDLRARRDGPPRVRGVVEQPRRHGAAPIDVGREGPDAATPAHCDSKTFGVERQPRVSDVAAICYHSLSVDGRAPSCGDSPRCGARSIRPRRRPCAIGSDPIALGHEAVNAVPKYIGVTVRVGSGSAATQVQDRRARGVPADDVRRRATSRRWRDGDGCRVRPVVTAGRRRNVPLRGRAGRARGSDEGRAECANALDRSRRGSQPGHRGRQWSDTSPGDRPDAQCRVVPADLGLLDLRAGVDRGCARARSPTARRRRHELAVLKAIGFTRGQVRATLDGKPRRWRSSASCSGSRPA